MLLKKIADRKAFSLIEITIVLAIAGIVIAGIWMAMATIAQNSREARLAAQITETMANGRRIFARSAELPNVAGTIPFTRASIAAGVFPADMVRDDTNAIHALGGNAYLAYAVSGTPVLNLTLAGMLPDVCARLVPKVVGSSSVRQQYGITSLIIGAGTVNLNNDVPLRNIINACNPNGNTTTVFNITFQFTIL